MDECSKCNTPNSSRRYLKHWQEIHTNCNLLFPLVFNLKVHQSHERGQSDSYIDAAECILTPPLSSTSAARRLQFKKFIHTILNCAVWLEFWQVSWSCTMLSSQPAATSDSRDGSWMPPALAVSGTRQQLAHKPASPAAPCLKTASLKYRREVTTLQYIPKTIKKSVYDELRALH